MNKNKKIITIIISVIVLFFVYRIYIIYSSIQKIQAINSMDFQYALDNYKKPNPDDIPAFAKKFRINENYEKDLFTFFNAYRFDSTSKNEENQKKYKETFEDLKYKITFNLDDFKNELIPYLLARLNDNKDMVFPSFEERKSLPNAPEYKTFENIAKYWVFISRFFEEQGDNDSSLLLFYGIITLLMDYETQYKDNYYPISEMNIAELGCDSILVWASRPKPQNIEMSKKVANALLKFAKTDYNFSNYLKKRKIEFEDSMQYSLKHNFYPHLSSLYKSKMMEEALNYIFEDPLKQADKPYYEIKNYLEKYTKRKIEADKFVSTAYYSNLGILNSTFLLHPEKTVYENIISKKSLYLELLKRAYEQKLAIIELTAIALAINSYYCEKNTLPKTMEELSLWFGKELPKDRITNKTYIITDTGFTLFNEGIYPLFPLSLGEEKKYESEDEKEFAESNHCFYFTFSK